MLWLIPLFPLAAAIITAFLGPRFLRKQSHWPCVLALASSCVLSVCVLFGVVNLGEGSRLWREYYQWFQAGDLNVGFTLQADGLTAVMLVTVTFVSTLIAIYSIGYMSHERE